MYRVGHLVIYWMLIWGAGGETCGSIDVRNYVRFLSKLQNCTEIAGNLSIVLIETTKSESDFDGYVYPKLQKVSGYVVIFKVAHLTSLGKLFPNLRLIRGLTLLTEFSLVLYDLPNLQEIGTSKLSYIGRGYVKIGKTPKLCHSNTVDWSRIGENTLAFYQEVKTDCPPCPAHCNGYCWNNDTCQTFTDQCHEECLGCTENGSNAHCEVCKNFKDDNGACVPECPPDKYALEYLGKCVTKDECLTPSNKLTKALNRMTWFTHSRECLTQCPEETQFDAATKTCEPCYDKCVKWCRGNKLMSEISLQSMRGCTMVNGSIAIQSLMGPRQKISLYKNLKHVRYIRDYLLIARNDVIEDLTFLPSLREIRGEKLYANKSLMVFENRNLKRLWDGNVSLVIRNGNIGFHDNDQLCLSKIEKFAKLSGIKYNENDVSRYSNGADCAESVDAGLQVVIAHLSTDSVTLTWQNRAENQILYYTVHYTDSYNVTQTDPNVCSRVGWQSFSTSNNSVHLTDLKTFKTYYYYIKIYHKNRTITRTPERQFKTLADDPRQPINFKAFVINSTAILLSWQPPEETYGTLKDYRISIYKERHNLDAVKNRDYCLNPFTREGEKADPWDTAEPKMDPKLLAIHYELGAPELVFPQPKCHVTDEETYFRLEDHVWLNLCDLKSQSKYGIDNCKNYYYGFLQSNRTTTAITRRSIEYTQYYAIDVPANSTTYTVTDLEPFSLYVFYIMACNQENYGRHLCSAVLQTVARTRKSEESDVAKIDVKPLEYLDVHVSWQPPTKPSGAVLAYHLYYGRNVEYLKNQKACFDSLTTETNLTLVPGDYYVSIQTVTLAGPSTYVTTMKVSLSDIRLSPAWITIIILSVTMFLVVVFCLFQYVRSKTAGPLRMYGHVNPDYWHVPNRINKWELRKTDLETGEEIGRGSFGVVHLGRIVSQDLACAIKMVKDEATDQQVVRFLEEAKNMTQFTEGPHVVKLYGVCSQVPRPMVAMELMERGDLKQYLVDIRSRGRTLSTNEIYRMAIEIADGLVYLNTRKYVHRDLAARNCMVALDRTVKIGDFGLTRDIYENDYYKRGLGDELLPVRWMAPESIADGVYTNDSDIWSYGIVLWEIVTLAQQPYQGLSNEQTMQFVLKQRTLERPKDCPNLLWEIMEECWQWRPMKRPTCFQVVERLQDNVSESFKSVSFYHSDIGKHFILTMGTTRSQSVPAVPSGTNPFAAPRTAKLQPLHRHQDDMELAPLEPASSSADPDYILPDPPQHPYSNIEVVPVEVHEMATLRAPLASDEEYDEFEI